MRHLYRATNIQVGHLDKDVLNDDDYRKIKQKVVNTKGEILFSKCIVFFEGETEEQALPILAQNILMSILLRSGLILLELEEQETIIRLLNLQNACKFHGLSLVMENLVR